MTPDENLQTVAEAVVATMPEPPLSLREKVDLFEAEIRKRPEDIVQIPVRHYFAAGLYAREIIIPAGVIAVGKIHKTEHINVLSSGEVTMATPTGSLRVKAPYTWVVEPNKKAVALAHEETVWTSFCINPTDERDVEKLEAALISPTYLDELEGVTVPQVEEA